MMGSSSSSTVTLPRRKKKALYNIALAFLLTCCFITLTVNFLHGSIIHNLSSSTHLLDSLLLDSNNVFPGKTDTISHSNESQKIDPLAGLDCTAFGGPSNDIAAEMVYWSDVPSDNAHVSPFYSPELYMTFEPDGGGWNNIRMAMETVLAMAHAMGRTLVLPPEQRIYLLHGNSKQREFDFQDFYPVRNICGVCHSHLFTCILTLYIITLHYS